MSSCNTKSSAKALLAVTFMLMSHSALSADRSKKPSPEEQFLRDAPAKLEERLFGKNDAKECEGYLKRADEKIKPRFALIYSRYLRCMEKEPVETLAFLGSWVMDKGKVREWESAQKDAFKAASDEWREEYRAADRESREGLKEREPTAGALHAPFPRPEQWTVNSENADLAIEIARCHMDLNRYQNALAIIDSLGKQFSDETRVLSAECAGDLMVRMQMYRKGVDWYEFSLKVLDSIRPEKDDGSYQRFYTAEQKIIRERVRKSLAEAKRLLEIELYGKGWVLYRDAERTRREHQDYLNAYLQYGDIKAEFPKTVYSEAATCYGIKCLLALADEDNAKKAKSAIAKLEDRLRDETRQIDKLKRSDVPKATIEEKEEDLKRLTKRIEQMRDVPVGQEALRESETQTKVFFTANQFGLYRGELLVEIAEHYLDRRLDPEAAQKWYESAADWLEGVQSVDAELEAFEVPTEAREVSKPPESSFKVDHWGNVQDADLIIGQILNRRTSRWYSEELRARTFAQLGFLAFVDENMEKAKDCFTKMAQADSRVQYLLQKKKPNRYQRLMVRCEQGAFRRSSPKDVSCFKNRQRRFVAYLADFDAESERPVRAEELYRRLMAGEFGRLSSDEEAYARFGLSWVLWYDGIYSGKDHKKDEAKKLLLAFVNDNSFRKADITPRALNALANMLHYGGEKESDQSLAIYRLVAKEYPKTEHAEAALYRLGVIGASSKDDALKKEAADCLKRLLSRYGKSQYAKLAKDILSKLEGEGES